MKSGTVVSKNGIYDVVNNDGNNDDIEFEEQNTPTPTPQLLLKKRDPLLRDDPMGDDSEVNLGSFTVNIPPPKINTPTTNNGFYKFNNDWNALTEGSSEDHDLIIQVPNTTETLTVTQNNQTYTPTQGNIGFRSVAVQVPELSVETTKTVNITENTTTVITPSDNYDSIGRLEITTDVPSQVNNQNLTTITRNGTYTPDSGYSGFNSFTVNVPQPSIQQNKSITLTNNQTGIIIPPDNGFDAFDQITVNVAVPTNDTVINNQNVNNNNLITSNGFYTPDSQHTGFNAFTVAIPLQKDKNIDVNGKLGQTIIFTPDAGYAGFEQTRITVIPPSYQTKTITSNGTYTPDSDYDGFSSVTVNVPSSGKSKVKSIFLYHYETEITESLSSFSRSNQLSSESIITSGSYLTITESGIFDEDEGTAEEYCDIAVINVTRVEDLMYDTTWYKKINNNIPGNRTTILCNLIGNNNRNIVSVEGVTFSFSKDYYDFSDLPGYGML